MVEFNFEKFLEELDDAIMFEMEIIFDLYVDDTLIMHGSFIPEIIKNFSEKSIVIIHGNDELSLLCTENIIKDCEGNWVLTSGHIKYDIMINDF